MGWAEENLWWLKPDQKVKCKMCGKEFIPAPEHRWEIGEHGFETRDIPVCSYTCMRKWEKEQTARELIKRRNMRRKKYTDDDLRKIIDQLEDERDKVIARLYFGSGERVEDIAAAVELSYNWVSKRIPEIKQQIKHMKL